MTFERQLEEAVRKQNVIREQRDAARTELAAAQAREQKVRDRVDTDLASGDGCLWCGPAGYVDGEYWHIDGCPFEEGEPDTAALDAALAARDDTWLDMLIEACKAEDDWKVPDFDPLATGILLIKSTLNAFLGLDEHNALLAEARGFRDAWKAKAKEYRASYSAEIERKVKGLFSVLAALDDARRAGVESAAVECEERVGLWTEISLSVNDKWKEATAISIVKELTLAANAIRALPTDE